MLAKRRVYNQIRITVFGSKPQIFILLHMMSASTQSNAAERSHTLLKVALSLFFQSIANVLSCNYQLEAKLMSYFISKIDFFQIIVIFYFLSAFLWNFLLCQDHLSGYVPSFLAQPCYVAPGPGRALICFFIFHCTVFD